jgi:hypothetical protein
MIPTAAVRSRQPPRTAWTLERLVHERSVALGQTVANGTWHSYGSALNSYLEFVRLHKFNVEPTPDTLSFYTVFMCRHIKPDSVASYLSGICHQLEPYFPNIRTICKNPLVSRTLAGCKRLYNTPTHRKRALTRDDLDLICDHYRLSTDHDDKLFVAMVTTGFFALMRLGELTDADNTELRDPRKTIRRWSVKVTSEHFSFFLPGHKGDRFFEGNTVVVPSNTSKHDPFRAFLSYLQSRDTLFPLSSPLWLLRNGRVPTRSWFIRRLRVFFDSSVAGQSMRAGGATTMAEMGVPPHLIQAAGRWKSEAFQIYVRKNPILIQALLFSTRATA